jgi:hypothetical protein
MGYATIAFPGGPGLKFRIDPEALSWSFQINTSVTNTVGGRVVQVNGATLSDITITGLYGEDRSKADGTAEYPGRSWRLAKAFARKIREMMIYQASDATVHAKMHQAAVFSYPPEDWKFRVYIKQLSDPDGGVITMSTGKFSHGYVLTLFVVQEGTTALVKAGSDSGGVVSKAKAKAINAYIGRISDGIGWKPSIYNGPMGGYLDYLQDATTGDKKAKSDTAPKQGSKAAQAVSSSNKQSVNVGV